MGNGALDKIIDSIVDGDKAAAEEAAREALGIGIHADEIINAIRKGMDENWVRTTEFFLPPRYAAAAAANLVIDVLRSHFVESEKRNGAGKVVIGVVEGDNHDLGKNLVRVMLEAAGYDVFDLGRNVPKYRYLDKINEVKADICALSATMTPSLYKLRETIEVIVRNKANVKLLIGGLAVNPSSVKTFGAHAYGQNETEAVKMVTDLLSGGLATPK
jgi:methanogenic corrinoid protein MtbC1